eukprot:11102317-Heterocapsa_arctica.AAC.1
MSYDATFFLERIAPGFGHSRGSHFCCRSQILEGQIRAWEAKSPTGCGCAGRCASSGGTHP